MTERPLAAIGVHALAAGGVARGALRYATGAGAEAMQVFVSSPRSWALSPGDPAQDRALRDHVAAAGLPVFVHAPYLINVGSPDPLTRERSVASLRHSLRRGGRIGARGVIVHTGSAVGGDRDKSRWHTRECLLPVLDEIPDGGPDLLLEPMAGQGQQLCRRVEDLGPYLDGLGWHPRAAVCLDTCHLFAAGHDLAAPGGAAATMAALAATLGGRARLGLVHANDSMDPCGSGRDRHQHIGAGLIGAAPFAGLLRHPGAAGVPFIVETPGPQPAQAADVAALKRLRGR
ncbi:MAG TPA: deoxyribonuclease IV [Streptosporangiaceae bacterium]|nr:deoxyribonuclease IV [Streptosporangiaceae bacterium]